MNETTGAARISRRTLLTAGGALAAGAALPGPWTPRAAAQGAPLKLGFQVHRTGIGAVYGRWYERTTTAAVKFINEKGGIGGRPIEIVAEDDGTDPKRGAEVVEKLAVHHKVDLIFGTLFSHVVIASAPRAGELKIPYLVVSEGYHVASGGLNRYVFQPGITDVRAQITAVRRMDPQEPGQEGHPGLPGLRLRPRPPGLLRPGGRRPGRAPSARSSRSRRPRPPSRSTSRGCRPTPRCSTTSWSAPACSPSPARWASTSARAGRRSSASSTRWRGWTSRAPGSSSWRARTSGRPSRATPAPARRRTCASYRERVGINDSGASVTDPKDVSTASHMFGCWETLFVIKRAVEQSGYKRPGADYKAFIETLERFPDLPRRHRAPPGAEALRGTDPPGVRPAGHLQGGEASAPGRAPDGDRGFDVRARGGLYEAAALGPKPAAGRRPRAGPSLPRAGGRRGAPVPASGRRPRRIPWTAFGP